MLRTTKKEEIASLEAEKENISKEYGKVVMERNRMMDEYSNKMMKLGEKFREINAMINKIEHPE